MVAAVAAVAEAAPAETAVVEEAIPLQQEFIDPVSATEEEDGFFPAAASPLPVTVTEEPVEPQQAESVSSEEDIAKSEEPPVPVEEDILESTTEVAPEEPEMVQPSPVEDVQTSPETDVQDISTDAEPAACVSETYLIEATSETIMITETTSETVATNTIATEDVLVSTGLIDDTDVIESIETEETPVQEELGADISSEAPTIIDTAAEETLVTEEFVSEAAPMPIAVEELISFENTASPLLDEPVQVQTVPDLVSFDPLLDPLEDTMQALKPVSAQEPEQVEQTTALPVKPEDNLEPAELLSPVAAPVAEEKEAEPEGAEEPAEDLEAEITEEVNISF